MVTSNFEELWSVGNLGASGAVSVHKLLDLSISYSTLGVLLKKDVTPGAAIADAPPSKIAFRLEKLISGLFDLRFLDCTRSPLNVSSWPEAAVRKVIF